MIVNVLRLTLKADTTSEQRAEVLAALRRTASLPSVAFSAVGPDLGDPSGLTYGYAVGIADLVSLEAYMHDPTHLAGDEVILPRIAHLSAVRFADAEDPDIAGKVYALHQAKIAKYPEWGRRLDAIVDH
jgi:hypothetical protein